jgi:hypothetical protein
MSIREDELAALMSASDKSSDRQQNTPGRFYAGWSSNEDLPPIERLMLAVLQDALECVAGCATTYAGGLIPSGSAQAAADWITDINDSEFFSFISICDLLRLDAAAARKAIVERFGSGLQRSRRFPVTREPAKLSPGAYRKRSPSMRRAIDNRASFKR